MWFHQPKMSIIPVCLWEHQASFLGVRSKSMCIDSLNSSDIACGEYASRTLAGKHAPSMAKTTAIDSKQCRRAKPEGSPTLLCALGSRFWGDFTDECRSSIHLGKIMGKK